MGDTTNGKLGEAVGVSGRTEGGGEAQTAPFSILASFSAEPEPSHRHTLISLQQSPCYHLAA